MAWSQTAVYPGAVVTDNQLKVVANNVQTTITFPVATSDTTIQVASSAGIVANSIVTIDNEIMAVCSVPDGTHLTIGQTSCPNTNGRGFDSSVTATHSATGANCNPGTASGCVSIFIDAWHHNATRVEVEAVETALGATLSNVPGTASGPSVPVNKIAGITSSQGNGAKLQQSTGATTPNDCVKFDANGNTVDFGAPCNTLPAGLQTQFLQIVPNTGNNTTTRFANLPIINATDYNFPAQAPGGSLAIGSNTINMAPCALGMNASLPNYFVYIAGGTGGAEAVPVTGGTCTSGATSGTLTITAANTHTGAWTVQSASGGIPEAVNVVTNAGAVIHLHGTYLSYAPIFVPNPITFEGEGPSVTLVSGQIAANGIFNTNVQCVFRGFQIAASPQQTAGAYGIRLTAPGSSSNTGAVIEQMTFSNLYDGILGVNASTFFVTNNTFVNMAHTGITAANANSPDGGGPTVIGNNFSNFAGAVADSAFLISNTGGIIFANNAVNASNGANNFMNYAVHLTAQTSSGLLIANNDFENLGLYTIALQGTYVRVAIVNNTISQFAGIGDPTTWLGILADDGAGAGITNGSIVNNVIQGIGVSGNSNTAIDIQGHASGWMVEGNTINTVNTGLFSASTTSSVTFGPNNIQSTVTLPLSIAASSIIIRPTTVTFAQLPFPANGSEIYCSDCNVNCTAGSSTGRNCFRENGAWTNPYSVFAEIYNTNSNASGAITITAAQITGANIEVDLGLTGAQTSGQNATLPSVASLLSVLTAAANGQTYKLRIINVGSGQTATVTTNSGWTLNGTMTIANNTWRDFVVTITSVGSATATLQSVGTGTQS